jgi:hypothetical protein
MLARMKSEQGIHNFIASVIIMMEAMMLYQRYEHFTHILANDLFFFTQQHLLGKHHYS